MYTTCMFCNKPLGSNQVVETFPVGRRLAFDADRGRLWVVCRKCERWNLSPLEERWEAVEDCERIFRGTRIRMSSENVGLAKHPEGLELVRIGAPLRPEFAAWRYGDQFGRRRQRAFLYGAAGVAVLGTLVISGLAAGVISGAALGQSGNFVNIWVNGRTLAKIKAPDGTVLKMKNPDLQKTQILLLDIETVDKALDYRKLFFMAYHQDTVRSSIGLEIHRIGCLFRCRCWCPLWRRLGLCGRLSDNPTCFRISSCPASIGGRSLLNCR